MRQLENLAWPLILAAATIVGSIAAACMMPFAALATVVAASMPFRRGVVTVTAIVAANQAIGFAFLNFPATLYTAAWGVALYVATLTALAVAHRTIGNDRDLVATHLILACASAFAAFEAILFAFANTAGGLETFTPSIIALLARNEALWLGALAALRLLATGWAPAVFGAPPRVRLA